MFTLMAVVANTNQQLELVVLLIVRGDKFCITLEDHSLPIAANQKLLILMFLLDMEHGQ